MKICHIATGFPISFQGGITNYVRTLAEYQTSMGHEVYVLSGPDDKKYSFVTECYQSDRIIPMKWRAPIDKDGLNRIKYFLDAHQFDLIHIHMMLDVDWDFYEVVRPYKYIISLHDYFFLCPRIQMLMHDNKICTAYEEKKCSHCISQFNLMRLTNALEYKISHNTRFKGFRLPEIPQSMTKTRYAKFKKLLENAAYLLPVSSRVQEIFEASEIRGNYKMLHIGNVTADKYREKYAVNSDKTGIDIAMLGTLTYLKGVDLFLEIAQRVNENVRVHFYGRSGDYADKLKAVGIIDHGPYKQDTLNDILNDIDMGMCLSVWEDNGPQVVMEFLNSHIPVIGTALGGIPDFVQDGVNGYLFDPFNKDDLERVISLLNSMSREKLNELKRNIKRTTTTREHCMAIDDIYKDVVSS